MGSVILDMLGIMAMVAIAWCLLAAFMAMRG
jgi:hypothetical protein